MQCLDLIQWVNAACLGSRFCAMKRVCKKYDFFEKSACIFENNLILYTSRVRQAAKTKYMRKCRNWQTSKTKDLVIIAIVWVQVPSSALNNKTGTKQSVWSLSCCSKPKRALNPWFKVSPPARSARGMRSPDLTRPIFRKAPVVAGQAPMGPRSPLRFGRRRADIPGCLAVSAPVVAEQTSPDVLQPIFRKASVVAGQALYIDKTGKVRFL